MKKIISIVSALILTLSLTACGNIDLIDTTFSFDKAIISFPDGTILEGKVDSWRDYENSDQIQVTIDGNVYLTHIDNIVLIKEKSNG